MIVFLKAEKLLAKTLPFPYTSEEVYEQSIRMPIGPDFNPAITAGTLNRPTVSACLFFWFNILHIYLRIYGKDRMV